MPPAISCMSTYAPPKSSRRISTTELCMSASRKLTTVKYSIAPRDQPFAAQELVERVVVVLGDDPVPAGLPVALDHRPQVADGRLPQLVRVAPALALGEHEREARRVGVGLRLGHPPAAEVDEGLGVAHHERAQRQPEQLAVAQREVVGARDAHAARLGVEPGRERAQRVDPPADAALCLEDGDLVALPLQLERRDEPRQPGPDDDDALGPVRPPVEALAGRLEQLGIDRRRDRRHLVGRRHIGDRGRSRPGQAHCSSATGSSSRMPAWMPAAFFTADVIAPSIQRRARRSAASPANQIRPTGRTMSS